ncbi:DUF805 domain-containing protein [Staphylococcus pettenkoferi]|uniref:DUF805 domain-containing protein n=1 Tax=Staphylococcus pettenkoferi TaxID=170573 RepID=UPI0011A041B2|nr:DUF805 domain-containing protein [Staphylococcus pettenkoferi]MCY1590287.1 DUF805 domain-containing protein [Staphylococcus pettenkoferi]MCY1596181.1 DUF805 domain-containing protein [Staphylococcus pettenkoferi]MCY1600310.1 DUF805 domain-containing protein [Staphylococcus pettenkoferi]MCY1601977.1 DUF805 domain-containing protein [Staphylococcus pettenkoferi]MCY1608425.1 DUF805 domain-containing protein [Staphylococcus pettenkoferi]
MNKTVGFGQAFKNFWKNYANFKGRARRSEYWWMMLWNFIFSLPAIVLMAIGYMFMIVGAISDPNDPDLALLAIGLIILFIAGIYGLIYFLATVVPNLSLMVRRFHDAGRGTTLPIILYIIAWVMSFFIQIYSSYFGQEEVGLDTLIVIFVGGIINLAIAIYTIVIACLDSKRGRNPYGESKKYPSAQYGDESKVTVF